MKKKTLFKDPSFVKAVETKSQINRIGRRTISEELGAIESFRKKLDNCSPRALENIVKGLYDMAVDRNEASVVRVRASEIILAYAMGKPVDIKPTDNNRTIVFTRAEPRLEQNRIEPGLRSTPETDNNS